MNAHQALDISLQPFYLSGTRGNIFCLFAPPRNKQAPVLLFLPSFAEELNRCRVMVALQARKLAALGVGSLLIDYYGTGDSQGDFSQTDWQQWKDDADTAYSWLADQGYSNIGLWGLRLGALLATELACQQPDRFIRLLLWQPVLDGSVLLTQFFRIRLAMLMDRGEPKETTKQMREHLRQGHNLEVAGYELTPQLVSAIDEKKLSNYDTLNPALQIDWFEAVVEDGQTLSPASEKAIAAWLEKGIRVRPHTYSGPFFWQLHERELTPELIDKTTELFRN
ncbi:hydrolase 2, exosortase A system-associated [Methylocaldum sp. GT1TLB]|jgi:exosortase A-associated hydrolase 2|uniref:hydrolase 2, exosortase A system-associated n=1 Tax=unclassified Methylocaldum TaxID=2622260 RepID=UPI003DA0F309